MLTLFSPAKINLFLKVICKRDDGYHNIVSLFQTISLADIITIDSGENDQITCSDPKIPLSSENTVIKALMLFRKKTGIQTAFKIHIEKQIPVGAGLGGGSSNAATTLFGLNTFLLNPLSLCDLHEVGQEIGSDVPFFLSKGAALCSGRGEIVEPCVPKISGKLTVVMPSFSLATKDVYQTLDVSLLKEKTEGSEFFNDLEEPAFKLEPRLKELKELLTKDNTVFMTGSGSALIMLDSKPDCVLPNCTIFDAHFITRKDEAWYTTFYE